MVERWWSMIWETFQKIFTLGLYRIIKGCYKYNRGIKTMIINFILTPPQSWTTLSYSFQFSKSYTNQTLITIILIVISSLYIINGTGRDNRSLLSFSWDKYPSRTRIYVCASICYACIHIFFLNILGYSQIFTKNNSKNI